VQNRLPHAEPTRLEVAVACAVSVPLGIAALIITGMAAVVVVPVIGFTVAIPVVLYLAAAGGAWLLVRGELPAKGFGAGVLIGWALVALWSAGASTGLGMPS
jgi:NO-binding membrane sensor protein with MHYT domain